MNEYILQMDVAGLTSSDWCLVETFIQTRGQQSFLAKNAGKVLGRTKTRFCVPSVAFGSMQHASICQTLLLSTFWIDPQSIGFAPYALYRH